MSRLVDRGAVVAAWVGVGMAVTVGVSFLLVIPIEAGFLLLAVLSGLLIGYYANARAGRTGGPWSRILGNAAFAGLVTGLTYALLLLVTKALFFTADAGYRDASAGGPLECATGAECVYERYLAFYGPEELEAAGVTDVDSFTAYYWREQGTTAFTLVWATTALAVLGGLAYGATRPKAPAATSAAAGQAPPGV